MRILILATYNTVLPLEYFDILSDQVAKKDDGFSEYASAANNFSNNEVQNANMYNKHTTYALKIQSKLPSADQDFIQGLLWVQSPIHHLIRNYFQSTEGGLINILCR